ncbi:hypothetical protein CTB96_06165 [Cryobacterium arcticum]|uniref:Uncharacterized protein n=2 Tax=Cryobacterium arcticum TaxID=670052 RepID=A0A317ZXK4_9MICO|nr:hypothetical protein CTB96_06165 [Cryobacterium arcticum]
MSDDAAEAGSDLIPENREKAEAGNRSGQDQKVHKLLADADRRDDEADLRDAQSDKRAEAADLEAFLDTTETYRGHGERRAAAIDRSHAKSDRKSSADDRAELAGQTGGDPDADHEDGEER